MKNRILFAVVILSIFLQALMPVGFMSTLSHDGIITEI